jgi:hypothetical protein
LQFYGTKIINKHHAEIDFLIQQQELETRKRISLRKSRAQANLAKRKKMEELALLCWGANKKSNALSSGRPDDLFTRKC